MTSLSEIGSRLLSLLRFDGAHCLRTPEPVQRLASQALSVLAKGWPALADLLPGDGSGRSSAASPEQRSATLDRRATAMGSGMPTTAAGPAEARGEEPRDALIACLRADADFGSRVEAARALAQHRDSVSTHALCEALRDPSAEVAIASVEALTRHGGEPVCLALRTVVTNADGYYSALVRASAVHALARLLPAGDRDLLVRAMSDVDAEVSIAAVTAAAEQPGPEAIDALHRLLADPSGFYLPVTRLAAARALARHAPLEAGRLQDLLRNEEDPSVRAALEDVATSPPPHDG